MTTSDSDDGPATLPPPVTCLITTRPLRLYVLFDRSARSTPDASIIQDHSRALRAAIRRLTMLEDAREVDQQKAGLTKLDILQSSPQVVIAESFKMASTRGDGCASLKPQGHVMMTMTMMTSRK